MGSYKKEFRKRLVDEVKEYEPAIAGENVSPGYDDCLFPEEREYIEKHKRVQVQDLPLAITTAERGNCDDGGIKATDIDSVAHLLDTIEVFDDDDLEAVDIVNRHIDFETVVKY